MDIKENKLDKLAEKTTITKNDALIKGLPYDPTSEFVMISTLNENKMKFESMFQHICFFLLDS